ncbi:MAG: GDSL-type esterase/lipase family protein [Pirellulaceae bacterium]|nr:GDSL-type esterase/lipase family protein [Pirellulaceae bacterium]
MNTYRIFTLALLLLSVSLPLCAQEAASPPIDPKFALPATDDGQPGAGPIRRYEKYMTTWAQKRSEWSKNVAQEQGALVLLGDSITQGWGSRTEKEFPNVKIANRGIGGDTTRGMLIRLDDVLALNPSSVVMLMGTNDIGEQAAPETIAGNVRLILDKLKKSNPKMPIVLCTVFPSSESKTRPSDTIKKLNDLYMQLVKGDAQVTVVDTWTLFADATGNAKPELFPDLLHLNEAGYQAWAAALRPIFATLGFIENEPDVFQPESGFVSLFNGRDLTGWGYQATSEEEMATIKRAQAKNPSAPARLVIPKAVQFDGKTSTPDGRYVAKNGRLIVTTPPEGRKIQQLWTTREISDDFVLKLEFRATPNADSGVFLRKPQLQCRDFPLAGPYKELKKYKPQDWNELIVEAHGDSARCTCNGEVLEEAFKIPASGPIGLEGDRGQMEYRRIRIKVGKDQ